WYGLEGAEGVVVPARVGRAADVPAAAVVGEEHAVSLERGEDDADLRREAGDVEVGAEPYAHAHGRQVGVGPRACPVARGRDVGAARDGACESERVADLALLDDLVVAYEAREDRQSGRVGGRPAGRSELVRAQVEDGARACMPGCAAVLRMRVEQLIEHPV